MHAAPPRPSALLSLRLARLACLAALTLGLAACGDDAADADANSGATSSNGGTTSANNGATSTNNATTSTNSASTGTGGTTSTNAGTTSTNSATTSTNNATTAPDAGADTGTTTPPDDVSPDAPSPDAAADAGGGDVGGGDVGTPDASDDVAPDVPPGGPLYVSQTSPRDPGPLPVVTRRVTAGDNGAPTEMLVVTPTDPSASYAVVVFQHGFLFANAYYTDLLEHIASHGFVVVAPQMYAPGGLPFGQPSTPDEAALAAQNLAWMSAALDNAAGVDADVDRLGLAGHSRGGRVIWLMLNADPSLASAVAGVDPVDGTGGPFGNEARAISGPSPFSMPTYVLGTGRGPESTGPFSPPCAPDGDNHVQFYGAAPSPAWHLVADDYGHNDMLNDNPTGCGFECTVCPAGPDRATMRAYVAATLTAFFIGSLQGDEAAWALLEDADGAGINVTLESR